MTAFFFFDNLEVRNPDALAEYAERVAPIVAHYGGEYRCVGGAAEALEGEWRPTYPVIIEFPSVDKAKAWYASDEYAPLKKLRLSAVTCNGVLIEGLPNA